jgi:hypothetical protein
MEDLEQYTTTCPAVVEALSVADGMVEKLCGEPAVELDRFEWPSTNGFVEHVVTRCNGSPRHVITERVGGIGLLDEVEAMFDRPSPVSSPHADSY